MVFWFFGRRRECDGSTPRIPTRYCKKKDARPIPSPTEKRNRQNDELSGVDQINIVEIRFF